MFLKMENSLNLLAKSFIFAIFFFGLARALLGKKYESALNKKLKK